MNRLLLIAVGMMVAGCGRTTVKTENVLRQRAERLAQVIVQDSTRKVSKPIGEVAVLTDVVVEYAPVPILTVIEWNDSGVVGGPRGVSRAQWSAPPGYVLKWDGGIPYCEPDPPAPNKPQLAMSYADAALEGK